MTSRLSMLSPRLSQASGRRCRVAPHRRGMSLIEVMLATVLLLGCVMALSRVAFLARKHAESAEDHSREQIYCQNIMEEIAAGIRPLSDVSPVIFEGEEWLYAVVVEPMEQSGLAQVTVTVDRLDDVEGVLPSEDEMGGYRLVRWIRTGDRNLEMLDAVPDESLEEPLDDLDMESGELLPGL